MESIVDDMSEREAEERLAPTPCSIFDMECCPLCGGMAGFTYRATIRGTQFMPWKGSGIDAYFDDSDSKHGAYRCDDCGKIIKSNA
jgi:hypothetical protein